ncbi:hypothetical protein [Jeongeupia sp. USM3]|uniref:hypothetical protein n=1 Tax=Jeongeupia sp. USM3 TaxID=1906741 RepID=UPI0011AB3C22|nr:hypothetical protein [Jeongeupia sp. USM3]
MRLTWICQYRAAILRGNANASDFGLLKFRCPIRGLSVVLRNCCGGVLTEDGEVLKVAFSADDAAKETKRNPPSLPSEAS